MTAREIPSKCPDVVCCLFSKTLFDSSWCLPPIISSRDTDATSTYEDEISHLQTRLAEGPIDVALTLPLAMLCVGGECQIPREKRG